MSRKYFNDINDNNDIMECDIDDNDNGDSINHCGGGDIKNNAITTRRTTKQQ